MYQKNLNDRFWPIEECWSMLMNSRQLTTQSGHAEKVTSEQDIIIDREHRLK